jgi:hypothetical protein
VGESCHDGKNTFDELGVQGRRGFVEEHDFGFHSQGARNRDVLLLASREGVGPELGFLLEPDESERFPRFRLGFGLAEAFHVAERHDDVAEDCLVRKEVKVLKNHADAAAQVVILEGGGVNGTELAGSVSFDAAYPV